MLGGGDPAAWQAVPAPVVDVDDDPDEDLEDDELVTRLRRRGRRRAGPPVRRMR